MDAAKIGPTVQRSEILIGSLALAVALTASAAQAQELREELASPEPGPAQARLSISSGIAVRSFTQTSGNLPITYSGGAPSGVRLSAAAFLARVPLGLALDVSGEWFVLLGRNFDGQLVRLPQANVRMSAALAARWTHPLGFSAEGQLGYAYGRLPRVSVSGTTVAASALPHTGPQLAVRLGYEPKGVFGIAVRGMAAPFVLTPSQRLLTFSAGAEAAIGRFEVLGLRFAGFVDYEFSTANAPSTSTSLALVSHRVGLGIQAVLPGAAIAALAVAPLPPVDAPKIDPVVVKPTGPGTLRGVMKLSNPTAPAADFKIQVGSATVVTGADGAFVVPGIGPGPVAVTVTAPGFEKVEEIVMIPPEAEAKLELVLKRLKGPGTLATLRGLIRSAAGVPVQAQVKIREASVTTRAGADGRFLISLPGGKYTVIIDARGYESQTKVVELADGDQAIFHLDLQPRTR